jgi:serine/threonine protein kinase
MDSRILYAIATPSETRGICDGVYSRCKTTTEGRLPSVAPFVGILRSVVSFSYLNHPALCQPLCWYLTLGGNCRIRSRLMCVLPWYPQTLHHYYETCHSGTTKQIRNTFGLLLDIATGLRHMHRQGLMHRDLKPANILVTADADDPHASITDFDFVASSISTASRSSALSSASLVESKDTHYPKPMSESQQSSESKTTNRLSDHGLHTTEVCTLWYRAPELLTTTASHCAYSTAVDVWSFGVILAEALFTISGLNNHYLWTGTSASELLTNIRSSQGRPGDGSSGPHHDSKFSTSSTLSTSTSASTVGTATMTCNPSSSNESMSSIRGWFLTTWKSTHQTNYRSKATTKISDMDTNLPFVFSSWLPAAQLVERMLDMNPETRIGIDEVVKQLLAIQSSFASGERLRSYWTDQIGVKDTVHLDSHLPQTLDEFSFYQSLRRSIH